MAREYKKLKRRLLEWETEFEHVHGRAPTADDRALNRSVQELYRRAQVVKAKLVVTIKDHMGGGVGCSSANGGGSGGSFRRGCEGSFVGASGSFSFVSCCGDDSLAAGGSGGSSFGSDLEGGASLAVPPSDDTSRLLMPTAQEVAAIEMLFHDFDVSGDGVIGRILSAPKTSGRRTMCPPRHAR